MEGKLTKDEFGYWLDISDDGITKSPLNDFGQLSIKNCQSIENGYDLDELAFYEFPNNNFNGQTSIEQKIRQSAFKVGFQKALEILGDKKFSDIDVKRAMRMIFDWSEGEDDHSECTSLNNLWDKYFESTQQTEWDVEIIKEYVGECKGNNNDGCFQDSPGHDCGCYEYKPKFDDKGCLILKRVI